jgi:iron complex outermembrane receptor protein
VVLNQTYVDSTQTLRSTTEATNLSPRPFQSAGLMFMQHMASGLDFSLIYYQVDPAKFAGAGEIAPAMSRTDIRWAWPLRLESRRGEISFVIQNLGPAYQDFVPDFYFRRQAYVMLRLDN